MLMPSQLPDVKVGDTYTSLPYKFMDHTWCNHFVVESFEYLTRFGKPDILLAGSVYSMDPSTGALTFKEKRKLWLTQLQCL